MAPVALRHRRRPRGRQRRADPRAGPGPRAGRGPGARPAPALRGRPRHPAARGRCCRPPSSAGLAAEGATSSTSACCRRPAWRRWPRAAASPAAVISASHNPFADNGIKLFAPRARSSPTRWSGPSSASSTRVLGRRRSAARRPSGAAVGAIVADADGGRASTGAHLVRRARRAPARRAARRGRLRQRRRQRDRAGGLRRELGRDRRRVCDDAPTGSTSTTGAARPTPSSLRRRRRGAGRGPRAGLRRRRRPGHRGRRARRRRRRRRAAGAVRRRPAERGAAGGRHGGRHGHDQPRASAWPWRAAASPVRRDRRRRPPRARAALDADGLSPGRRAVGPHHLPRPGRPPATAS